ncbi:MAG: outer membrane beta-barrel protein [Roseovarius sp.]
MATGAMVGHAAEAQSGYDWTGFYVGGMAGYGELDPNSNAANLIQPDSDDAVYGLLAGYNYQFSNRFVLGIEADWASANMSSTTPCFNPAFNCNAGMDSIATLRARAGVALDRVLLYGTAGYAHMEYSGYTQAIGPNTVFPDSSDIGGWTYGVGLDYALNDRVTIGAEARWAEFDRTTLLYDVPYSVKPETFQALLRVTFKLGGK